MTSGHEQAKGAPGRPPAEPSRDVRADLLAAAQAVFVEHGFHAASLRRIAALAGVNPAMIHYYFGNKKGLYRAMLKAELEPVVDQLAELADTGGDGRHFAERVLALYADTISKRPWLPALIARDVLVSEGPARRVFVEVLGKRIGTLLPELIRREQAAGSLREDLDPRLAALSLISLAVFPMLALPVAGPIVGYGLNRESLDRLVRHHTKLFREGTNAK